MNKIKLNLHMISDSSGETLVSIARASIAQFSKLEVKEYVWSLINSKSELDEIVSRMKSHKHSFVIYTIINDNLREYLKQKCQILKVPCIPVLSRVIREISSYVGIKPNAPQKHYELLSDDYYSRVDAMNYVLSHDDGQGMWDVDDADIILVGVSRTSKSPTSVYLAYRGYKVSNIPFVQELELPIKDFGDKLVVALTIDPDRLIEIRKNRMVGMGNIVSNNYIGEGSVITEIEAAKKLFRKQKWPIIDVTKISVEEIAARVIQYYYKHNKK